VSFEEDVKAMHSQVFGTDTKRRKSGKGVLSLVVGWAPSMPVVTGSIPGGGII